MLNVCSHLPFVCLFFLCVAAAFLANKDEYIVRFISLTFATEFDDVTDDRRQFK